MEAGWSDVQVRSTRVGVRVRVTVGVRVRVRVQWLASWLPSVVALDGALQWRWVAVMPHLIMWRTEWPVRWQQRALPTHQSTRATCVARFRFSLARSLMLGVNQGNPTAVPDRKTRTRRLHPTRGCLALLAVSSVVTGQKSPACHTFSFSNVEDRSCTTQGTVPKAATLHSISCPVTRPSSCAGGGASQRAARSRGRPSRGGRGGGSSGGEGRGPSRGPHGQAGAMTRVAYCAAQRAGTTVLTCCSFPA